MTVLTLNLKNVLAKDVPARIRQFLADIQLSRTFETEITGEEIFLPASTFAFISGVVLDKSNPLPEVVFYKGDGDHVGNIGDYHCRSNIYTLAHQRDDENVPELSLRYKSW